MKKYLFPYILLFFIMIITPAIAFGARNTTYNNLNYKITPRIPSDNLNPKKIDKNKFILFDQSSNKTITLSDRDFMYGAVIAEMPPTFNKEALKAQAVASYTFFSKKREEQRRKHSKEFHGADFVVNTEKWQYYVTKEQMEKRWGRSFDTHYNKLTSAIDEVIGEVIENDGELIVAAYHAISGGTTEKSKDVFGGDLPYLTSVPSPGDLFAPNYCTTAEFDKDAFKSTLMDKYPNAELDEPCNKWIAEIVKTNSGTVKSINIGGVTITGIGIRNLFGLRSADFDLVYKDDKFTFTVRGYGHGVGMSQYGAEYMAQQGYDYKQILSWYYPGTYIKKL